MNCARMADAQLNRSFQLARLESLAVYFDTDCQSLAGLSYREFVEKFTALVSMVMEMTFWGSTPFLYRSPKEVGPHPISSS